MKKQGILNPDLNAGLARLGHGDLVVIADCGLPLSPGASIVDLALVMGVPGFTKVLTPYSTNSSSNPAWSPTSA